MNWILSGDVFEEDEMIYEYYFGLLIILGASINFGRGHYELAELTVLLGIFWVLLMWRRND